ncbi:OmpA family protein [Microbacterium sp. ARD32]|uniref:OmpA family protein n=1 Tax=Microbacterium sp. ARD32 TaxID=2962577 RepID=UPI0028819489|nr:OmpA family protein [Microbacterium sp. ARD32]MDT0157085.1 OmpA family protein [Microbacterium sp. ARD32]
MTRGKVIAGLALLGMLSLSGPGGAAHAASTPRPKNPSAEVPYQATVAYRTVGTELAEAKFTVLTVARIKGATVVYYALTDATPGAYGWLLTSRVHLGTPYRAGSAFDIGLVDATGQKFYMPLEKDGECLCGIPADLEPTGDGTDPVVGYAVMPELPASLTHVSVQIGGNATIPDVPIAKSPPKGKTVAAPVPLGNWPILPRDSEIAAADPGIVTLDLIENVADKQMATSTDATSTTVALNSDVLFEFGKADLTPQASRTLTDVAADIDKRAKGPVAITGYTDAVGKNAANQVLSERRAQSVLAALRPLVKNPAVTFTIAGRGEQDPVADNGTDEGRALNRRVTVAYITKEAE